MCRHKLYFKGMYKLERVWEQERIEKMNQDAFNEEFDYIFEEEELDWETSSEASSESDAESETESESQSEQEQEQVSEEPEQPRFQLFENFFDEDKYYSDFMLGEIEELQKSYQKAMELGVNFDWYVHNHMFYNFSYEPRYIIEDDVFPHDKNLFVSNYNGDVTKRCNARVPPKGDTSFVFVLNIEVF
jgi:hypothetical protein